jgi:hypothetical protein
MPQADKEHTKKAAKKSRREVVTATPAEPPVTAAEPQPVTPTKPAKPLGVCASIKELLIRDPKLSLEALTEELQKQGLQPRPSTVLTMRTDVLDTFRRLQAAGHLPGLEL